MSNSLKTALSLNILRVGYVPRVPSWRYSHASTPTWRFYWNPEPGAWLFSRGNEIMLDPDVAVLVPPQTPFSTGSEKPFSHFFIHFNFVQGVVPKERVIRQFAASEVILPHIGSRLSEMSVQQRYWAASSVLHSVLLLVPENMFYIGEEPGEHDFFNRAVKIMEKDPAFSKTAAELAEMCGTSVNTLQRQFLSATGVSVRKWLLNLKMEKAVQYLTVEKCPIKEVAYLLGFADRYHFSKSFKQYFGTTPAHFIKSGGIPLP